MASSLLTLAMTGGISPQKALVISLPLDGGSCAGLLMHTVGCGVQPHVYSLR